MTNRQRVFIELCLVLSLGALVWARAAPQDTDAPKTQNLKAHTIQARRVEIVDDKGNPKILLNVGEKSWGVFLAGRNALGSPDSVCALTAGADGNMGLSMFSRKLSITARIDEGNAGLMASQLEDGKLRSEVSLFANEKGESVLNLQQYPEDKKVQVILHPNEPNTPAIIVQEAGKVRRTKL